MGGGKKRDPPKLFDKDASIFYKGEGEAVT